MDCIFCKIINHTLPANIVYEDAEIIAFDDLHPKAPCHKLIIPKKHVATMNDLEIADKQLLGNIILVAQKLANRENIAANGYRLVVNCNRNGGQMIYHLHFHLLGGKKLSDLT